MCDSGSLGIEETDKQGGVDMGIISGHCHLMLHIYNHVRKNAAAYGLFWVVFGLYWRPQGPLMCDSRFLEMFEIRPLLGVGVGISLGHCIMISTIQKQTIKNVAV